MEASIAGKVVTQTMNLDCEMRKSVRRNTFLSEGLATKAYTYPTPEEVLSMPKHTAFTPFG